MAKLSIIIPFGTSKERPYIKERVVNKANEYKSDDLVEYIFVEGFSSLEHLELKNLIENKGHRYFKDATQQFNKAFSLGQCRNLGIVNAKSDVVMSLDVDYVISEKNLENILELISIKEIDKNPNAFLVLPCIFLNEFGTEFLQRYKLSLWDNIIIHDMNFDRKFIKFLTPASSTIIMNRFKFLELGGNDQEFVGHGYEDFDLMMRILKNCTDFEAIPTNLEFDYRNWSFNDYKGFRALFSVVGNEACVHGIYLYHLWHAEPNQNGYLDNRELNHQKFYQKLKNYKDIFDGPDTLIENEAKNRNALVFFQQNSNLYSSLRAIMPYFEKLISAKEYYFFDEKDKFNSKNFLKFYHQNNITHIIFPNSHANEKRLEIFQFIREKKLPFIVFDRGALPDSWFFDDKGFNYDSTSYDEKNWNKTLNEEQKIKTLTYIEEVLKGEKFLEKQGLSKGSDNLKRKLGLRHKKIFFVPLQVKDDSVLKNFTYEPFSYENFLNILNELAKKLLIENIVFVVKKHPLSLDLDKTTYDNLIFVPDDTNLNDLLGLCNGVLTLNSGVGVYAILAKKPCIVCANAFYRFDNLNLQANNEKELFEHILNISQGNFNFDEEKALRFIHYLRYEFYSFGKSYYKKSEENGRIYTKVYKIEFYSLILFGKKLLDFNSIKKQNYKLNSPIYKPYIYEIKEKKLKRDLKDNGLIIATQAKISHFKFYRLFRKFITSPKDFIMDSKKPFMKPIKLILRKAL
ncbi:capsular biosynthesis protein [Campylobacter coli]|nr:capsular biosynthesis protein [Campylobacter coli]EAK0755434.1 capsular biosynthesis protein [Campylobacter coli]ECY0942886.1 capsular biosynthesis protein [Campylobacter coli]EFN2959575.1 capsular biosynthesis protein [Campylobacter coli]EIM0659549.1 capsular biosynthesis protein [Campylobacter coli]